MNKKQKKELLDPTERAKEDVFVPIIIGYTVKWGLKRYKYIFKKFPIRGNIITSLIEGIRW